MTTRTRTWVAIAAAVALIGTATAPAATAVAAPDSSATDTPVPNVIFPDSAYFGFSCQRPWDMAPWVNYGTSHPDWGPKLPLRTQLIFETDRPAAGGFHVTMHTDIPEDHYEIEQQTSYRVIVHLDLSRDDFAPHWIRLDWDGIVAGNFTTTVSVTGPAPGDRNGDPDQMEKQTARWTNEPIDCAHGELQREWWD
ncbi:hypothetical protein AAEP80_14065 [Curtobacterium sp. L3-7]|uniref:hypothetical protein n=1 Tax=Curtobacterium sp. L3-7 TaxID=3138787 RepID=UPI003B522FFB